MATWRNKNQARLVAKLAALLFLLFPATVLSAAEAPNTCLDCHSALDAPLQVTQDQFAQDIHAQKGLSCASCHGGDPTNDGPDAMSKKAGFIGKPARKDIPALCGKCHSDSAYMRKFNPSLRTDQLSQYGTSVHGQRLAKGDTKVAVCIDCHGVHGMRPASDTRSKVHPLNVAETCARCHANSNYMKDYKIPTSQYAEYTAGVHHEALAVRGDLSAPTCTTCHGNHGAAPPGVSSVQNVCSTCHVFQSQLFDSSPHKTAFQAASLPGCVTCHSNHKIVHPTDAMLGTGPGSVCTNCHTSGDAGYEAANKIQEQLTTLQTAITRSDEILKRAEASGMEVSESRLEQDQARDALTKARVSIHSFQQAKVDPDIQSGMKIAAKTYAAGVQALKERDYRRWGLAVSVVTILIVVLALGMYIKQIERS
jgi:nitrate/TMAO reductase-like tetraheme cytochrome c subunit